MFHLDRNSDDWSLTPRCLTLMQKYDSFALEHSSVSHCVFDLQQHSAPQPAPPVCDSTAHSPSPWKEDASRELHVGSHMEKRYHITRSTLLHGRTRSSSHSLCYADNNICIINDALKAKELVVDTV